MDDQNQNTSPGGNVINPAPPAGQGPPKISKVTSAISNTASPVAPPPGPPLTQAMSPDTNAMQSMPTPLTGTESVKMEDAYLAPAPTPKVDSAVPEVKPTAASIIDEPNEDLIEIKKEALQKLAPLVDKLDQTPEEKFKTLMMLIQASDNPQFVKVAFETADKIPDENTRAQALLDVVNEINYFTQPKDKKQ